MIEDEIQRDMLRVQRPDWLTIDRFAATARQYWHQARHHDWPMRVAGHFCFCAVLLVGLAAREAAPLTQLDKTSFADIVAPFTQSTSKAATHALAPVGIGGEEEAALVCAVVPVTTIPRRYRIDPLTYVVEGGDNVSTIANKFGISIETVLWANGPLEDNPDFLSVGDELTILPVSGVYHTVAKGETLEEIAAYYKVKVEDITQYEGNYMQEPYTISVGQKLIVPGGEKPRKVRTVTAWAGSVPAGATKGSGTFGYPISGYVSQGYHEYHIGLDIAAPKGTPVKAADSGYVAIAARQDSGYGLYVVIDHGNGFQTLYAHFSAITVKVGQSVTKGQQIGLCGSTGKSTGPHVHFEIKLNGVRRNPAAYLR